MQPKRIGLSGTAIKSIALFLMVLDHIYYKKSAGKAHCVSCGMKGR